MKVSKHEEKLNEGKNEENEYKKSNRKVWLGYLMGILASILSATGNLFIKMTDENKLNVVLIRNGFQFFMLLPILTWKKTDLVVWDLKLMALALVRGLMEPGVLILIALSMNYLPLGDAVALMYTYPIFVGFFACLCLKEKCGILFIILTITTLAGFVLVAQPSFIFGGFNNDVVSHQNEEFRMLGAVLAVSAAILAGLISVILRKIGTAMHFSQSMLHAGWEGALFSAVLIAANGSNFLVCFHSFSTIIGCSISLFFCQLCRTVALQLEKAGTISLIQSSQVVFSFILQYIFLNEVPNLLCIIGSSLILISCVALGIKNIFKTIKAKE